LKSRCGNRRCGGQRDRKEGRKEGRKVSSMSKSVMSIMDREMGYGSDSEVTMKSLAQLGFR